MLRERERRDEEAGGHARAATVMNERAAIKCPQLLRSTVSQRQRECCRPLNSDTLLLLAAMSIAADRRGRHKNNRWF